MFIKHKRITTHLPTPEGWMAELAKACSMQPYITLYKTTLQLGVRNLPKVFTRQTVMKLRCDTGNESTAAVGDG